jgi:hypothetical protein
MLESTIAVKLSSFLSSHLASLAHLAAGSMLALSVVPSTLPDAEDIAALSKLTAKLLPDCEIVKLASAIARDLPQGKATNSSPPACIFQIPPTDTGATSVRPLLSTATSPSSGRTTPIK